MTNGVGPVSGKERSIPPSCYHEKSFTGLNCPRLHKSALERTLYATGCKEAGGVMRSGPSPVLPHSPAPGSLPGCCGSSGYHNDLQSQSLALLKSTWKPELHCWYWSCQGLLIFPNVSEMHGALTNVRELPHRPGFQSNKSIGSFLESWRGRL